MGRRHVIARGHRGRADRGLFVATLVGLAGSSLAGSGACCLDDGTCQVVGPNTCEAWGGTYQGDGVNCEEAACFAGACCLDDGPCEVLTRLDCVTLGGDPRGEGVACEEIACRSPLWDNDLEFNGFNGRAVSPPGFPDIRVADDVTIADDEIWSLQAVGIFVMEDNDWEPGAQLTIYLYDDAQGSPGSEIAARTGAFTRTRYPYKCSFIRDCFTYWFEFDDVRLPAGTYWIGPRNPQGAGEGTNYWLTSEGGDGTERTAWFSLDAGATWLPEGDAWHHTFEIRGAVVACPPDVDDSRTVDFDDLLAVLAAWGPYAPCPSLRREDVDGDCDVGFSDLLSVLAAWGPCPAAAGR